jgi:hypothetical protein
VGRSAGTSRPKRQPRRAGDGVGLPTLRPHGAAGLTSTGAAVAGHARCGNERGESKCERGEVVMAREAGRTSPRSRPGRSRTSAHGFEVSAYTAAQHTTASVPRNRAVHLLATASVESRKAARGGSVLPDLYPNRRGSDTSGKRTRACPIRPLGRGATRRYVQPGRQVRRLERSAPGCSSPAPALGEGSVRPIATA